MFVQLLCWLVPHWLCARCMPCGSLGVFAYSYAYNTVDQRQIVRKYVSTTILRPQPIQCFPYGSLSLVNFPSTFTCTFLRSTRAAVATAARLPRNGIIDFHLGCRERQMHSRKFFVRRRKRIRDDEKKIMLQSCQPMHPKQPSLPSRFSTRS